MGKKRSVQKAGGTADRGLLSRSLSRLPKRKIKTGVLHVNATYNNTKLSLCDEKGNSVMWSSTGALGFKGTKKSTPFAAAKVAALLADKAEAIGLQDVDVVIKGVGPGRESAMRSFVNKGFVIGSIVDKTPIPHNGPKRRKPRRV
ncbi:MAG: 30S ribosomal protein S11 [Candidatus Campbellbacteria bacterium]|nr:30S ribosomal protein S11 [Candidatus Campbellbacteria bacterium]